MTVQVALNGKVRIAEVKVTSVSGVTVTVPARVISEQPVGVLEFESPFEGEVKASPVVHYEDGTTLREVRE